MRAGINWLRLNDAGFGELATENERISNLFSLAVLRIGGFLAGQMFAKRCFIPDGLHAVWPLIAIRRNIVDNYNLFISIFQRFFLPWSKYDVGALAK